MKLLVPFAIDTPEQTRTRKLLFAEALLKNPQDPFKIALKIVPDTGAALQAATEWPADLEVIEHQRALLNELGEAAFLPSEFDAARLAYSLAEKEEIEPSDRIKALELYGKFRGLIQKPETVINNNNQTNVQVNRVMVVKEAASVEDWQAKAMRQQARLRQEVLENVTS